MLTWEEDDPCHICETMGEDNDLVNWILCSFCSRWCHSSCVNIQFDSNSAKGIVKFKCPICRKSSPDSESEDDNEDDNEDNEKKELIAKLDKMDLLLEQEKDEVKTLKKKD